MLDFCKDYAGPLKATNLMSCWLPLSEPEVVLWLVWLLGSAVWGFYRLEQVSEGYCNKLLKFLKQVAKLMSVLVLFLGLQWHATLNSEDFFNHYCFPLSSTNVLDKS